MKRTKTQKVKFVLASAARAPRRMAPRRRRNRSTRGSGIQTPLLPTSVNNHATAPVSSTTYRMKGCEYFGNQINLTNNSQSGSLIFNKLVTMAACPRLLQQSRCWQKFKVNKLNLRVVPLNGSTADSGYTATMIDDPSYVIRTDTKGIINLTAFAKTSVRQSWVQTEVGTVGISPKPNNNYYVQEVGDPRLFSPGRAVIQLNGSPVNSTGASVTFVPMLDYDIEFMEPGVDSAPEDQGDFNVAWSNNQSIGINPPNGPGLRSSASLTGLRINTNYYVRQPVPVTALVGGINTAQWCIGFRCLAPAGPWSANLPIRTTRPEDPAFDNANGITPTSNLGENLFFEGTGFATERPDYTQPS